MLHDPQGHVEGLEVLDERAAVLSEVHRAPELTRVVRRELDFVLAGEVDDGVEAQRAVEVDVEVRLGELAEELERELVLAVVGVVFHDPLYQHGASPGAVSRPSLDRERLTGARAPPPGPGA